MKIALSLLISISTLIFSGVTMATEHNSYFFSYKSYQIPCTVRINGIFLVDSYDYGADALDRLSMGFDISQFVNIGANEITIQADNGSTYIDPEEIEQAYCEVTIKALISEPDGANRSEDIAVLRYTFAPRDEAHQQHDYPFTPYQDDDGTPHSYQLVLDETPKHLISTMAVDGFSDQELAPFYTYVKHKRLEKHLAKRTFVTNDVYPFRWITESTPLENTPENKQKVWDYYQQIRHAIESKNKQTLRSLVNVGLEDMAKRNEQDVDARFDYMFNDLIKEFFEMGNDYTYNGLTIDDFDLELYHDGKSFRLNKKGFVLSSPLNWKYIYNKESLRFNPLLTLINGRIEFAFF